MPSTLARSCCRPPKIEVQSPPSISLLGRCQVGCSNDRMRFVFTTRASPEQVLRALTDFTESHLETWNRTLDPKTYELRESGQTWAVAQVCQRSARTHCLYAVAVLVSTASASVAGGVWASR